MQDLERKEEMEKRGVCVCVHFRGRGREAEGGEGARGRGDLLEVVATEYDLQPTKGFIEIASNRLRSSL